MGNKKPSSLLDRGPLLLEGSTKVFDFQRTRLGFHLRALHADLEGLFKEFAKAASISLTESEDTEQLDLSRDSVVAVCGPLGIRTRTQDRMLRAYWTPFALFVEGTEVCSLKASYGTDGARLTGIRLIVNGEPSVTRRKKLSVSVVRKVCLSYIHTYLGRN